MHISVHCFTLLLIHDLKANLAFGGKLYEYRQKATEVYKNTFEEQKHAKFPRDTYSRCILYKHANAKL